MVNVQIYKPDTQVDESQIEQIPPTRNAVLIGAAKYRRHSYGSNHPLSIPRVSLTMDLIKAYGAVTDKEYLVARKATDRELQWFHTREYVSAMHRCEVMGKVRDRYRNQHNIGNLENPYFPDFFTIPGIATGASVQGAEQVIKGRMAFNPAGGMHHSMPDSAQGFCFFNDPVLGIMRLRNEGMKVLYVDIDAHHGDGVEYAFRDDPDVVTFSMHMNTDYGYPFKGGQVSDQGQHHNAVNLPLEKDTNDTEYRYAFGELWPRILENFKPDAVVLQAGTDMLRPDPLGKFCISTQLFLEIVEKVIQESPKHSDGVDGFEPMPRLLVVGGGGYHPLTLARCWTGVWAHLSGRDLPVEIPPQGEDLLREVDWELDEDEDYFEALFTNRLDPDYEGEISELVKQRVEQLLTSHPLLKG